MVRYVVPRHDEEVSARRTISRFLTHLFFTEARVENADRLPATGPVVVVANHHSSLIDPMLLLSALPRSPRFLAKATLWTKRYVLLHPVLALGKTIAVHRRQDGADDNAQMFAECAVALAAGDVIGLFGEGISHDMPGLADIRSGAARIALGTPGTPIVPVGIVYDQRERFRSAAVIRVGQPVLPPETHDPSALDQDTVRELTGRIAIGLAAVAPTWEDWESHRACRLAAGIAAEDADNLGEITLIAERLKRAIDAGDDDALELLARVAGHDRDLQLLGVTSHAFGSASPARRGYLQFSRTISNSLLGALAWGGRWAHRPPFRLIGHVASSQDLNAQATAKLIGGLLIMPLWWVLCGALTGILAGTWAGLGVFVGLSLLGYVAARRSSHVRRMRGRRKARRALSGTRYHGLTMIEQRSWIRDRTRSIVGVEDASIR